MGFARAERADIETVGRERQFQRRVIDLGIVGETGQAGITIELEAGQDILRPFSEQGHVGEAFRRGEGSARIDHGHVEAGDAGEPRQSLRGMHGADHEEANRRHLHSEEIAFAVHVYRAALA